MRGFLCTTCLSAAAILAAGSTYANDELIKLSQDAKQWVMPAGNYANISPLMDLLFGTYQCPDHEPASFGLRQPIAETYLDHMVLPLLPGVWKRPRVEAVPEAIAEPAQ